MTRNETDSPPLDLIVVGAGPAGVAAAVEATRWGLRVLVLDENAAPGGRAWQAIEARGADDAAEDEGLALIRELVASDARIRQEAAVWGIERDDRQPGGTVFWREEGVVRSSRAKRILLATGTTERALPIPGWTLPGVMTVGAAQIALKTAGLVTDGATWIAGQGPLIWLYAVQVLRAGGKLGGIVDLSAPSARWRALPRLPRGFADLRTGLTWMDEVERAGIARIRGTDLRAEGNGALDRITFKVKGETRTEAADLLLLHDGVVPSLQLTRALDCAHVWYERQRCWRPVTDAWGETNVPGIIVAGDGAGVGGAAAAVLSGRIAALGAVHVLGRFDAATRDRQAAPLRAERAKVLASRPFLDSLFAPRPLELDDDITVCRCEDVTAGQIRAAAREGCQGLNQLKAFTRCGMGPCQGRVCGPVAAEVLAKARGVPAREIEPFRARFPARPVTVGELAALAK